MSWVPVDACALPTPEQPLRAAEFDALFADALVAVETPDAAAAVLRLAPGAPPAPPNWPPANRVLLLLLLRRRRARRRRRGHRDGPARTSSRASPSGSARS